jgi:hypothetical protein
MMQAYTSDHWEQYKEFVANEDTSNNYVCCTLASDYQQWPCEIGSDLDDEQRGEFQMMACMFLHMSNDFTLFVQSYCAGDAVSTIKGYDWFTPV